MGIISVGDEHSEWSVEGALDRPMCVVKDMQRLHWTLIEGDFASLSKIIARCATLDSALETASQALAAAVTVIVGNAKCRDFAYDEADGVQLVMSTAPYSIATAWSTYISTGSGWLKHLVDVVGLSQGVPARRSPVA